VALARYAIRARGPGREGRDVKERPEDAALFPEWNPALFPTPDSENPQWNWEVRKRAHRAMNALYQEMQEIARYRFEENGRYIEPSGVADGGDVTGVMLVADNEVLSRLDRAVRSVRDEFHLIYDEVDDYKRAIYGPCYRPNRRDLHTGAPRTREGD
jgi:hypothetical protein